MANTSLADEIITIVKSVANNNPAPQRCNITKIYEDRTHVDVMTELGELKYVDAIGSDIKLGNNAIIFYLNETYEDYVVIADSDLEDVYEALSSLGIRVDNLEQTIISNIKSKIAYGKVDPTSTSTLFTATVEGVRSLEDGTAVMLRNGIVTSAKGFTLNVNGLGEKPVYNSMADVSRDTTIFNIAYTMLFVYDSTRVEGGCWICYRGYDSNTNTIGYQIRTNNTKYIAADKFYRYRLLLQVDDDKYMPVNLSTSTNATSNRSQYMNDREFLIDGQILYYGSSTIVNANAEIGATSVWKQYTLTLGYSFNNTGAALNLQYPKALYMVAKPTGNGKAKLNAPYYTQTLPNAEDGLIYIHLGQMYSATNLELSLEHKVYEFKNNEIREYSENNFDVNDYNPNFTYSFGLSGVNDTITIHTFLEKINNGE